MLRRLIITVGCVKKRFKDLELGGRCDKVILVGAGGEKEEAHLIKMCMEFSRIN